MKCQQILILVLLSLIFACTPRDDGEYHFIQGFTQGTTYHITYQHLTEADLTDQIDSLLRVFDKSLSTYDSTSIISRINRNNPDVRTDTLFRTVFREAKRVNEITDGAFDITLGPVIDAWGFGAGEQLDVDSAMIDSLLQFVGMDKVWMEGDRIVKSDPRLQLNVNAIAQGYAVDVVSHHLEDLGCKNYMVEIGGEVRTKGVNPKRQFWRIGIDRPEFGNNIPGDQLQVIISLRNRSLATSGNYRKYYEKDGIRVTHSIDPKSGYPAESRLLSATVLAEHCMTADAFATACMVQGYKKSKLIIENLEGLGGYFIFGGEDLQYRYWVSKNLEKYIEEP
jgi:thiamine biosynthesis lipoprotein